MEEILHYIPGMYNTLQIMGYLPYQLVTVAGFLPSTVLPSEQLDRHRLQSSVASYKSCKVLAKQAQVVYYSYNEINSLNIRKICFDNLTVLKFWLQKNHRNTHLRKFHVFSTLVQNAILSAEYLCQAFSARSVFNTSLIFLTQLLPIQLFSWALVVERGNGTNGTNAATL